MNLIFLFILNFISLIFLISSASKQTEHFNFFEYLEYINVIRIDINKINENKQTKNTDQLNIDKLFKPLKINKGEEKEVLPRGNTLEVIVEYKGPVEDNSLYFVKYKQFCNLTNVNIKPKFYPLEDAIVVRNGIRKIHFIEEFKNEYREGFYICLISNKKTSGRNIMWITPLFHNKLKFEPKGAIENKRITLIKLEWVLNFEENVESYVQICIKSKKIGRYFIVVLANLFSFYVNFDKEIVKCFDKIFKNFNEQEKKLIGNLKGISWIDFIKIEDETQNNLNDSEMDNVVYSNLFSGEFLTEQNIIKPLFDDGTYFFEKDKDGNINEKKKIIFTKNVLKNYLNLREVGKNSKNNFLDKDWQEWFKFGRGIHNKKYFKMDKDGKSYKIED
ncbi:hypothetical protein ACQ4LE_001967 [Meloidogyne hapla]